MSKIAQEIREAAREQLKDLSTCSGNWYRSAKHIMTSEQKHNRKKKFLNAEEAIWWVGENVAEDQRSINKPYRCRWCPFWHLTTGALWEK